MVKNKSSLSSSKKLYDKLFDNPALIKQAAEDEINLAFKDYQNKLQKIKSKIKTKKK